ncbi:MAG: hypothetical protein ACRBCI_16060, partial [Cellvibrionaceae bacterium]
MALCTAVLCNVFFPSLGQLKFTISLQGKPVNPIRLFAQKINKFNTLEYMYGNSGIYPETAIESYMGSHNI